MTDYVDRATVIYRALKDAGVDQRDIADLTTAVLQEEAKDYRMEFIDEQKNQRVQQMRIGDQDTAADTKDTDTDTGGGWRTDPATDAQKKALENLGVDFDDALSKGDASDLIDEARAQQQAEA